MLAIPDDVSSCAKLLSPADEPIGTPSSKIWCPEAPSSTPLPPLSSSACFNSLHVVSNCAEVLACPNSYSRANFSRMFKLRTNARAPPACVSGLMLVLQNSRFPSSLPSTFRFRRFCLLLSAFCLLPRHLCLHTSAFCFLLSIL